MNDPHKLLPEDISDETATAIDNLLGELAETWKWRYFAKIQQFHEDNRPEPIDPFEPLPPWGH